MNRVYDHSLDYQRGIACLLMIFAHMKLVDPANPVTYGLRFAGELAPMIFFTVSGFNAWHQARKYTIVQLVASNAALFLFGITYSAIIYADQYRRFTLEIFQIIALGSLMIALVQRMFSFSHYLYLLLAMLLVFLKLMFDLFLPGYDGFGVLLTENNYVPHYALRADQTKVLPGFPLLPWLAFFSLGAFIGQTSNRQRIAFAAICAITLVANLQIGLGGDVREKWDMSLNYALLGTAVSSALAALTTKLPVGSGKNPLLYFGQNSLLFFYSHLPGIALGFACLRFGQAAAWSVAFVTTLALMKALNRWNGLKIFDSFASWWLMLIAVLALPAMLIFNQNTAGLTRIAELCLGVLFAKHFPALRKFLYSRITTPSSKTDAELLK